MNALRLICGVSAGLAALGVVFACLASPDHFQPILSVAISCMAAIAVGTLCIWAFRNPAPVAFLPSLAILTGTIVGIASSGRGALAGR